MSSVLTGVDYSKSCINSFVCSGEAIEAAIYDYVGAVYGDLKEAKYDGRLTEDEKAYVQTKFGKINDLGKRTDYISKGQAFFLERNKSPLSDQQHHPENFHLRRFFSDKYGPAILLGGEHYFGKVFGDMYLNSGAELEVASKPDNWVFFLERSEVPGDLQEQEELGKNVREEMALFQRIASILNIDWYNAAVSIYAPEVIQEAEKRGITKVEVGLMFVFDIFSMTEINEQRLVRTIEFASKILGLDEKVLGVSVMKLLMLFQQHPDAYQGFSLKNGKIQATLVDISNQKSVERIKGVLNENRGRSAFFQTGFLHEPIVEDLYR